MEGEIFLKKLVHNCTEVRLAGFISSGFITAIAVNSPEWKLAKRTSVNSNKRGVEGGKKIKINKRVSTFIREMRVE